MERFLARHDFPRWHQGVLLGPVLLVPAVVWWMDHPLALLVGSLVSCILLVAHLSLLTHASEAAAHQERALEESSEKLRTAHNDLDAMRERLQRRDSELERQRRAALNIAADARAAQRKAEAAEIRATSAVEAAPNAIVMVDETGTIVLVNDEAERLFGYARFDLIGQTVETLVPSRFAPQHPALVQGYAQAPARRSVGGGRDVYAVRRDGTEFPVEIGLNPMRTSEGRFVLGTIVDLTERVRIAQELEHRSEEMEQLLYTVTHDLKSPLVTIQGFSGMIGSALERGDEEEARDSLHRVERATRTMVGLIDDLLELGRVGRPGEVEEWVDVNALLLDLHNALSAQFAEAEARLICPRSVPRIHTSPKYLRQVFLNLLGNALKYGCPEPGLSVRVGYESRPRHHAFFVQDQGPGIPRKHHQRIFVVFRRLESRKEGSGLGLAIVRKAARILGGDAWVDPSPDRGAAFWFTIAKGREPTGAGRSNHGA